MALPHSEMNLGELAQEMWKRADTLEGAQARAEMERRRTIYMRTSAIATSVAASAAALTAIIATFVAGCR